MCESTKYPALVLESTEGRVEWVASETHGGRPGEETENPEDKTVQVETEDQEQSEDAFSNVDSEKTEVQGKLILEQLVLYNREVL